MYVCMHVCMAESSTSHEMKKKNGKQTLKYNIMKQVKYLTTGILIF